MKAQNWPSSVLEKADMRNKQRSFLGGIVNTAMILHFEGFPVASPLIQRTKQTIAQGR